MDADDIQNLLICLTGIIAFVGITTTVIWLGLRQTRRTFAYSSNKYEDDEANSSVGLGQENKYQKALLEILSIGIFLGLSFFSCIAVYFGYVLSVAVVIGNFENERLQTVGLLIAVGLSLFIAYWITVKIRGVLKTTMSQ